MRKKLSKINNVRTSFDGIFVRYGTKPGYRGGDIPTILLKNICRDGVNVSDHIWFTMTKGFSKLGYLRGGEKIQFHARVKQYVKGYRGWDEDKQMESPVSIDYKLSNPTKIEIVPYQPARDESVFTVSDMLHEGL
jgi:hypothetical protein